ncbi:hypothetical protein AB7044_08390 [Providencia stuartii]
MQKTQHSTGSSVFVTLAAKLGRTNQRLDIVKSVSVAKPFHQET